ncbi:LysE family translocator [Mitsuaria sp. WAJ17]|uniref:LysE family translocator n=1 Tax=Mitsuaria sp. WAJ17 TaxID=2761452 RepID=UPI001603D270|nr:LysE family translocator [Mitsuaria sp. WAJ17]MBB2483904.1 LysE family translocator [Mitsuaria sp. WAJ17]
MPSLDTLLAFLATALVLGFTPGPDNLFVLMQSATQGRRAGLVVVLGLCTGIVVHTTAVALGLAALLAASPLAFTLMKAAGAAYLLYLAWGAWHAPAADLPGSSQAPAQPLAALYRRGIVMNLSNPKVLLFFFALLPQFVAAERGPVAMQLAVLGAVFIVATLITFGSIAWAAGLLGERLRRSPGLQRGLNRCAALVFAGLALRLATVQR